MLKQSISPWRSIFFAGDSITIRMDGIPRNWRGRAVLRTTLGGSMWHALDVSDFEMTRPGAIWHDIDMKRHDGYADLTLGLPHIGVFEAKCCFVPDDGSSIAWADGDNFLVKVESPASVCCNSIYAAFVRQFGEFMHSSRARRPLPEEKKLSDLGYTVIPPSGTFRNVIAQLDHIFSDMRCRILQLLPIHPLPTQYGRMGRYGSPFAAIDYFNVDPALADFDEKASPMEQLEELIDAVHGYGGRIFLDIPVNHTGWASKLQNEHPSYFVRKPDGTYESPGAWGVVWADLIRLDYDDPAVISFMAKVFLFWCRKGIDGFRCDAGYMVPEKAWDYIVSRVRSEYTDTVFLLEGLGGDPRIQERLLRSSGLDWGYSELFQNYSRDQISSYFPYMMHVNEHCGGLVNFAETHDNNRLATGGPTYARLRFLVNGLLAVNGSFGFANGAEFFATEKIDVHGCGGLNFGAEPNLVSLVSKLNRLYADVPAFWQGASVELVQTGPGNVIAALRTSEDGKNKVMVLLNLDCDRDQDVHFFGKGLPDHGFDLISESKVDFKSRGDCYVCSLKPGCGMCVAFGKLSIPEEDICGEPAIVVRQRAFAMAQRVAAGMSGFESAASADPELMVGNPTAFVADVSGTYPPPITFWNLSVNDQNRRVMVPSGDALAIVSPRRFRAKIRDGKLTLATLDSVPMKSGEWLAMEVLPPCSESKFLVVEINTVSESGQRSRVNGRIVQLPVKGGTSIRMSFDGDNLVDKKFFAANDLGGYILVPADLSSPKSKYEALLAVNDNNEYPVDRKVLFSSFRAWLVIDDMSHEISPEKLVRMTSGVGNSAEWIYSIATGPGRSVELKLRIDFSRRDQAVRLTFSMVPARESRDLPPECVSMRLIVRPNLENRVNHHLTKAYTGPERDFPRAYAARGDSGFVFYGLTFEVAGASYFDRPEWHYMNQLPFEENYGQDHATDCYSPGYCSGEIDGKSQIVITVKYGMPAHKAPRFEDVGELPETVSCDDLEHEALAKYVVRRNELSTVIAGYPWFLDWGRDTLIALRGLVRCGFVEESRQIILAFARFERNGTIPNMIRGDDDANRDTSDAPLYLIVAVRDYMEASGDRKFMDTDCGGRTVSDVLHSILRHYISGTPNGIRMDAESGLVFSPVHFTWMDTNYPAGTPREGYPIEIQCLWYAALMFLGEKKLAAKVSSSIEKYFFSENRHFASDCLHAYAGCPARMAVPDDHLRSNSLLGITLGAVRNDKLRHLILMSSAELLVAGGIRTLADRPVEYGLPIDLNGTRLNDPYRPFWGEYRGPEDSRRKPAYHNGTVWCWPFPAYCEALYMIGGESVRQRALELLLSARGYFESGVIGHLPEVADGNRPHKWGGCPAQAWSMSEFFRVYELLKHEN
ncbi:MAG: glycogen debranching enzyme N-terminal domain-containing protein [Victivallaceae bacterium]|nr:glycogen debranching enzyme N-terminal domain-containing protein [Victivallaceae bacterium]